MDTTTQNYSNTTVDLMSEILKQRWPYFFSILPIIFTLLLNILLIVSVFFYDKLHEVFYYGIASMSVGHILNILLFVPLLFARTILENFPLGDTWCFVWESLGAIFTSISTIHLCMLAYLLQMMFVKPLIYKQLNTRKKVVPLLCCCWIFSIILSVPSIIFWKRSQEQVNAISSKPIRIHGCGLLESSYIYAHVIPCYGAGIICFFGLFYRILLGIKYQNLIARRLNSPKSPGNRSIDMGAENGKACHIQVSTKESNDSISLSLMDNNESSADQDNDDKTLENGITLKVNEQLEAISSEVMVHGKEHSESRNTNSHEETKITDENTQMSLELQNSHAPLPERPTNSTNKSVEIRSQDTPEDTLLLQSKNNEQNSSQENGNCTYAKVVKSNMKRGEPDGKSKTSKKKSCVKKVTTISNQNDTNLSTKFRQPPEGQSMKFNSAVSLKEELGNKITNIDTGVSKCTSPNTLTEKSLEVQNKEIHEKKTVNETTVNGEENMRSENNLIQGACSSNSKLNNTNDLTDTEDFNQPSVTKTINLQSDDTLENRNNTNPLINISGPSDSIHEESDDLKSSLLENILNENTENVINENLERLLEERNESNTQNNHYESLNFDDMNQQNKDEHNLNTSLNITIQPTGVEDTRNKDLNVSDNDNISTTTDNSSSNNTTNMPSSEIQACENEDNKVTNFVDGNINTDTSLQSMEHNMIKGTSVDLFHLELQNNVTHSQINTDEIISINSQKTSVSDTAYLDVPNLSKSDIIDSQYQLSHESGDNLQNDGSSNNGNTKSLNVPMLHTEPAKPNLILSNQSIPHPSILSLQSEVQESNSLSVYKSSNDEYPPSDVSTSSSPLELTKVNNLNVNEVATSDILTSSFEENVSNISCNLNNLLYSDSVQPFKNSEIEIAQNLSSTELQEPNNSEHSDQKEHCSILNSDAAKTNNFSTSQITFQQTALDKLDNLQLSEKTIPESPTLDQAISDSISIPDINTNPLKTTDTTLSDFSASNNIEEATCMDNFNSFHNHENTSDTNNAITVNKLHNESSFDNDSLHDYIQVTTDMKDHILPEHRIINNNEESTIQNLTNVDFKNNEQEIMTDNNSLFNSQSIGINHMADEEYITNDRNVNLEMMPIKSVIDKVENIPNTLHDEERIEQIQEEEDKLSKHTLLSSIADDQLELETDNGTNNDCTHNEQIPACNNGIPTIPILNSPTEENSKETDSTALLSCNTNNQILHEGQDNLAFKFENENTNTVPVPNELQNDINNDDDNALKKSLLQTFDSNLQNAQKTEGIPCIAENINFVHKHIDNDQNYVLSKFTKEDARDALGFQLNNITAENIHENTCTVQQDADAEENNDTGALITKAATGSHELQADNKISILKNESMVTTVVEKDTKENIHENTCTVQQDADAEENNDTSALITKAATGSHELQADNKISILENENMVTTLVENDTKENHANAQNILSIGGETGNHKLQSQNKILVVENETVGIISNETISVNNISEMQNGEDECKITPQRPSILKRKKNENTSNIERVSSTKSVTFASNVKTGCSQGYKRKPTGPRRSVPNDNNQSSKSMSNKHDPNRTKLKLTSSIEYMGRINRTQGERILTRIQANKGTVFLLLLMYLLYTALTIPYYMYYLYFAISRQTISLVTPDEQILNILIILQWITMCTTIVNPTICWILSNEFKKGYTESYISCCDKDEKYYRERQKRFGMYKEA